MTRDLIGKFFGDRRYISQKLFEELYKRGLELNLPPSSIASHCFGC
ncbi:MULTISPECIES: hypothetical protein [unclassified Nostoc]|nr:MULTISPECIES: hypothetical protein [unclassified Nostoc]MDZ8121675.1 hypothetical protein [Nostoc sp. CmiVER01]MDZ8228274.1 hypothetical protein [Nostoc sp. ChiVER01]